MEKDRFCRFQFLMNLRFILSDDVTTARNRKYVEKEFLGVVRSATPPHLARPTEADRPRGIRSRNASRQCHSPGLSCLLCFSAPPLGATSERACGRKDDHDAGAIRSLADVPVRHRGGRSPHPLSGTIGERFCSRRTDFPSPWRTSLD